jgi:RimJ/RimL family protein N-acetyltransferase
LLGRLVRLRPPTKQDVPRLSGWYLDPELVSPFDRYAMDRPDDLAHSLLTAPQDPTSLAPRFMIEPIAGGPAVGAVGHFSAHPILTLMDVWYVIGAPEGRGKGYGSDAVGVLIGHLFATTVVERVGAVCDVANVGSYKLLEHLGLRREGTYRSALYHHAGWHDVAVYGITRSEWTARSAAPG